MKHRLEQLDDLEEGSVKETLNLGMKEYVRKIDDLNRALMSAWDNDQRVRALKIAIQVLPVIRVIKQVAYNIHFASMQSAKLLSDTSVIQFYPSKFVLITDILDNFGMHPPSPWLHVCIRVQCFSPIASGHLVFDRIRRKSTYLPPGATKPVMLPENFTSDQVPQSGKETCRNWFFKIASIRELIPRLYP